MDDLVVFVIRSVSFQLMLGCCEERTRFSPESPNAGLPEELAASWWPGSNCRSAGAPSFSGSWYCTNQNRQSSSTIVRQSKARKEYSPLLADQGENPCSFCSRLESSITWRSYRATACVRRSQPTRTVVSMCRARRRNPLRYPDINT
jgi:hypothetical protein